MPLIDVIKLSKERCTYPIHCKLKYASEKNFVGRPIKGYHADAMDIALMTPSAAQQLCLVQDELITRYNYGLLIYDAYRPKMAVNDFIMWSKRPPENQYELVRKKKHYPNIEKSELFKLGYVAEDSGHCYGNTVDLVLIDIQTSQKLEMGARYDYMDEISHTTANATQIGDTAFKNRKILSGAMQKYGFQPLKEEFWHFSHLGIEGREVKEPMNIEITPRMRGR